jgi:PPE-SVP subfamily C-terminal region
MEPDGAEEVSTPKALSSFGDFSSIQVEAAGLGRSAAFGSLAVPPSWPDALPVPADPVDDDAAPAPDTQPGLTYQEGLMGMMTGHPAITDDDTTS